MLYGAIRKSRQELTLTLITLIKLANLQIMVTLKGTLVEAVVILAHNKNIKSRPSGLDRRCAPGLYVRRWFREQLLHPTFS
tara:strand:+ start:1395 stop:1637 length:243 start_codon:yes stop_codon:yes gene_type:complete